MTAPERAQVGPRGVVAVLERGPRHALAGRGEDLLELRKPNGTIAIVAGRPVVEQRPPEIQCDGLDLQDASSNFGGRLARNAAAPSAGSLLV